MPKLPAEFDALVKSFALVETAAAFFEKRRLRCDVPRLAAATGVTAEEIRRVCDIGSPVIRRRAIFRRVDGSMRSKDRAGGA